MGRNHGGNFSNDNASGRKKQYGYYSKPAKKKTLVKSSSIRNDFTGKTSMSPIYMD